VKAASTRSTKNVPMMASTPTPSGKLAATTLPNTNTKRMRVIGSTRPTARARSFSMVVPTWRKTSANPPTPTVTVSSSRVNAGVISSISSRTSLSLPLILASTNAC
jgi:hypothetical protein